MTYNTPEFANTAEARDYINRAVWLGSGVTDFIGMSSAGGGEQVKGHFTRTTYPDRIENETEYGYIATANRIMRNVARNESEGTSQL